MPNQKKPSLAEQINFGGQYDSGPSVMDQVKSWFSSKNSIPCESCPSPERCMRMGVCAKKAAYK